MGVRKTVLRTLIPVVRRGLQELIRIDRGSGQGEDDGRHMVRVRRSTRHDMARDPDEQYFREVYWDHIRGDLEALGIPANGRFLDLGCGQGRMTLPLARWARGGSVTGVDGAARALDQARRYAAEAGQVVAWEEADLRRYIGTVSPQSLDAALFLEVIFFLPGYTEVLAALRRALKPGGVLFVTFRSLAFYAQCLAYGGLFDNAGLLLESRSGRLFSSDVQFNWLTSAEAGQKLIDAGFSVRHLRGIGSLSGIAGDPSHSRPSKLNAEDLRALRSLEDRLGDDIPDLGRYMLATAVADGPTA